MNNSIMRDFIYSVKMIQIQNDKLLKMSGNESLDLEDKVKLLDFVNSSTANIQSVLTHFDEKHLQDT
jgi:hypothetical protein